MTINALLLAEHKLLAGSVDEKLRECIDIKVEPVWTANTLIRKIKGNGKEYDLVLFYFDGLNSLHESTGSTYIQLRNSGYKGKILLLAEDAELINERLRQSSLANVYTVESMFTKNQLERALSYLSLRSRRHPVNDFSMEDFRGGRHPFKKDGGLVHPYRKD